MERIGTILRYGVGLCWGVAAMAAGAAPAWAQSLPDSFRGYEARSGLYLHDPESPERGSADINAEFLAPKLPFAVDPRWSFLVPRPHLGGTLNTKGRTSHAYAGFTWTYDVTERVFVEGGVGLDANNGKTGDIRVPHYNAMGCAFGLHEMASLGYRMNLQWSLLATVEHVSNAGLCNQNRGLTNVGLRLGFLF
jgi:lipid A 3-O-deacylase